MPDCTHRISMRLLEEFELRWRSEVVELSSPAQRVLAYLALHSRPVQRRAVAEALWSDCDERQASARLRSTLWRLPSPGETRLVEVIGSRLQLGAQIDVDVRIAEDEERFHELGVGQLSGDVLATWSEDWVAAERERFRQLRLHRLEQLSERAQHRGHFRTALDAALSAVSADPLRESAHRRVMQVHLAEENPSEALRQFQLIRRMLREDLGLPPSASTRSVVSHLLGRPLDSAS
jgi:DNA-binding SARP family transcriptional activator